MSGTAGAPTRDSGTVDRDNPWPGLAAFREVDRAFFHGRETVSEELVRLILRSKLTLLYALSGLGKTSLLRAGVFPPLRQANVLPIYVRLRHGDRVTGLRNQIFEAIAVGSADAHIEAPAPRVHETLWEYFHRKDVHFWNERNRLVTPLLALDQFEEIFTIGRATDDSRARVDALVAELADLVEGRPPASVRARFEQNPDDALGFASADQPCKILLSLREDFLPDLGELRSQMTLGDARLRLQRMTPEEALRVVASGGHLVDADVADRIVRFVASAGHDTGLTAAGLTVDPALLSVFCRELNNKRRAQGREKITADLLEGSRSAIIADFYERTISEGGIGPNVRVFVEERLLTESGFRDSIAEEQALLSAEVTAADLETLIARRLLRREEVGTKGRARIELTHDVLADAVRVSRDRRRLREQEERRAAREREREARLRLEAEEVAQRAQQRKEVEAARALAEKERETADLARALAREEQRGRAAAERMADVERRARLRQRWLSAGLAVFAVVACAMAWLAYRGEQRASASLAVADTDRVSRGELWPLPFLARAVRANPDDDLARAVLIAQLSQEAVPVAEFRHPAAVKAASLSRDGHLVLTQSEDGVARLWDVRTGAGLKTGLADEPGVRLATFSPDGTLVLALSGPDTALVFDARTGMPVGQPARESSGIATAQFGVNGKRVALASKDRGALVWTPRTGEVIRLGAAGSQVTLALAPDATHAVIESDDGTAWLWHARTGSPVGVPLRRATGAGTALFSPDSLRLVTVSDDGLSMLWDVRTAAPVGLSLCSASDVIFSPDGKRLLAKCLDNTVGLWDARTGKPSAPPLPHESLVQTATFSTDGTQILTGSGDGWAQVWDAASGLPAGSRFRYAGTIVSAGFSPDGSRVLIASQHENAATLWDARAEAPVATRLRHDGPLSAASFSPDGRSVVTASYDGTAKVWDVRSRAPVAARLLHRDPVYYVAFSPDGTLVVTASEDHTAQLWDPLTGMPIGNPLPHAAQVRRAAFSPDGATVVTASEDRTARLWDARTGLSLGRPMGHSRAVRMAAFSARGDKVVTASEDGTARVWDAASGAATGPPLPHEGAVVSAVFDQAGTRVVTASGDGTARIWDANSGKPVGAEPMRHGGAVTSATFSPDATGVLTTSADRTARLWDARTGKALAVLHHAGPVNCGTYSDDGSRVVTGSDDRTARVWDAATGAAVGAPLRHESRVCSAAFSRDGRVVTASDDGTVKIWNARTGVPIGAPLRHDGAVAWAAVSPDGARVASASRSAGRVWDVPTGSAKDAAMLAELAEAINGHRIDRVGAVERLDKSLASLAALRARVRQASAPQTFGATFARWVLTDPWDRTISPLSVLTVPDHIRRLLADENGRTEAERAFAGHPALLKAGGGGVRRE